MRDKESQMDDTSKENNFLVDWKRGINQYEVQMERKRGTLREADVEHWTLNVKFTLPSPHIPYGIHMEWIYSMDSTWIPYGICFDI